MNRKNILAAVCVSVVFATVLSACGDGTTRSTGLEFSRNMYDPLAFNPDQPNSHFLDGKTAQTPPSHTTPIGFVRFDYGKDNEEYERAGKDILVAPIEASEANITKGKELFTVYCAVCHGKEGKGDGPITVDREVEDSRGKRTLENFPPPPSFQKSTDNPSSRGGKMFELTPGKVFHTITYGWGAMGSHASQMSPEDRWKVVLYVQELQKK